MCEPTSSLIVVNQPLTQASQRFPFLLHGAMALAMSSKLSGYDYFLRL